MSSTHLFAMIPLLILLVSSLVFFRVGLLHLITLAYSILLGYIAINGNWELLFFAPCCGAGVISLILFGYCMAEGEFI